MWILVKRPNRQYLGLEAKNEKSKTTLFFQTFEVAENKSLFANDYTAIFKVNNHHPSDILRFWGVTKSWKKIIKSTGYVIPVNSTVQRWQRHIHNKTWYRSSQIDILSMIIYLHINSSLFISFFIDLVLFALYEMIVE